MARIVVVGGGISGLATSFYLSRMEPASKVTLLESSDRLGGIIRTDSEGGFLMEGGPDAFVAQKKQALDLCRELGIADETISTVEGHRQSFVWFQGRLHPLPTAFLRPPINPGEIVGSSLLSATGRKRALREPQVPARHGEDESVSDFITRRFGHEVLDRIMEPLTVGIFGCTSSRLSVKAAFPRLVEHERSFGKLLGAGGGRPGSGSAFLSLKGGMQRLTDRLIEAIEDRVECHRNDEVARLSRSGRHYGLTTLQGRQLEAQVVVLALPAPGASALLRAFDERISRLLGGIDYPPAILACLGYSKPVLGDHRGTGFVVHPGSSRPISACTWVDQKFRGRSPPGGSLLRLFISGTSAVQLISWTDSAVARAARAQLDEMLGIREIPDLTRVYRWATGLPVFAPGHIVRVRSITDQLAQHRGLYLVGNYLDGVGIPDCIRHARSVAGRVVRAFCREDSAAASSC